MAAAEIVPGTQQEAKSDEPLLQVKSTGANSLKVGKHVFELTVVDDANNPSDPAKIVIIVEDKERPTAVVDFVDERGNLILEDEVRVPFGRPFTLTGIKSTDAGGGRIVLYHWKLNRA